MDGSRTRGTRYFNKTNYEPMRKITISIGSLPANYMENSQTISIRELFSLYPEVTFNRSTSKCNAIVKYAQECPEDFFVENAINSISDYTCLKEELHSIDESINQVVVCYPTLSIDKEYGQLYQQHSRWMDYSPEAAKQIAKDHVEMLMNLVERIKEDDIQVIVIPTGLS